MNMSKVWKGSVVLLLALGFFFWSFSSFQAGGPSVKALDNSNVDTPINRISVTGDGVIKMKADTALVILGAQTDGSTAEEAQAKNATLMNAVVGALKRELSSNDKWETSTLSLYPQYDYSEAGIGKLTGFRAENQVLVTLTDPTRAGEIVDIAVKAGANTVVGIQFTLRNPESTKLEAIKLAMAAAKAKAEAALGVEGKQITGVQEIVVSDGYYSPVVNNFYKEAAMGSSADSVPAPVEPGAIEVRVSVSVTYTF
jgi:uncharacterized protein YggE